MERPDEFYTSDTHATDMGRSVPIFAALHLGVEERDDRCVSLAVGQSVAAFKAPVARSLAEMLLRAADILDSTR